MMAKTLSRLLLPGMLLLSGCSGLPQHAAREAPVWLLGEVHDNPAGHQQRLAWLKVQLEQGWRPVIAMEQFDREQQPQLDAALRECADSGCVLEQLRGSTTQWQWADYQPVIDLALQYRLSLLAANLSRRDAGRVMRQGYAAALETATIQRYRLDQPVAPSLWQAQRSEIVESHCGMLPESAVDGMVRAQIARDVVMAQVLSPHADKAVVLLAGNGHVRRDIGVPYWLRQAGLVSQRSVGFVETAAAGEFDIIRLIPAHSRPDPCAALR